MRLLVVIEVNEIPDELTDWPVEDWGTPGIALITQDGDGGPNWVESVQVLDGPASHVRDELTDAEWRRLYVVLGRLAAPAVTETANLRAAVEACAKLPCIRMFWGARRACPEYDDRAPCAPCQARAALAGTTDTEEET